VVWSRVFTRIAFSWMALVVRLYKGSSHPSVVTKCSSSSYCSKFS
jgi:hypothetical protein